MHYSLNHNPLLFSKQCICQHISNIILSGNLRSEWFTHCNILPHCMIENGVVFLPQDWLQSLSIINNRHVITVNIGWSSQWHTHHSKIIYDSTEWFNSSIHWYKLIPKEGYLNIGLLLRQQSDQCNIHVDQKTSLWTFSCLVPGIVTIYHNSNINFFTPWLKRIWRNCFGGITI